MIGQSAWKAVREIGLYSGEWHCIGNFGNASDRVNTSAVSAARRTADCPTAPKWMFRKTDVFVAWYLANFIHFKEAVY